MRECYWSATAPLDSLFLVSFSILQEYTFLSYCKVHHLYVYLCFAVTLYISTLYTNTETHLRTRSQKLEDDKDRSTSEQYTRHDSDKVNLLFPIPLFSISADFNNKHYLDSKFLSFFFETYFFIYISENRRNALIKRLYVGTNFAIKGISSSASSPLSSRQVPY